MRILVTGGLGAVGFVGRDMTVAEAVEIMLYIGPRTVLFVC